MVTPEGREGGSREKYLGEACASQREEHEQRP